jgi:hypothetical protein
MEKGRTGIVEAFSTRDAQRLERRPSDVRKLNPNLIDPSGNALHLVVGE